MTNQSPDRVHRLTSHFVVAVLYVLVAPWPALAADYYWDGNDATNGFGIATGTWAAPTLGTTSSGWSTSSAGTLAVDGNSVTTTTSDVLYFGTADDGLAAGTITLSGTNLANALVFGSASGAITLAGGVLELGGATPTITVDNAENTISSALGGTGALTKGGAGTLVLGGNNTYSGATTISAGTLRAGGTSGLSANSALSVAAGAFLNLGGFNNTIKSLSTATGTVTNSTGSATLTITTMAATAQLFTGNLALRFSPGQINSSILLNTNNTFSGGITIGNAVSNDRFLLSGVTIGTGTPGALTHGLWGTGALTLGTTNTDLAQILFVGASTINNAIVVNSAVGNSDAAGAFRVDSAGNVINGAINANLAAANFRNGGNFFGSINLTGAISGNSGLTLLAGNGTGTLNLTLSSAANANTYAGDTIISSAKETLTLGAANQIANGAGKGNLVITNGNFKMGGFSETINGLSGTGTVDGVSGTPTLTVGDNNATSTFSGNIVNTAGTLALTKIGAGTLTLAGTNNYGGATTISAGSLIINGNQSVATGVLDVASGATLGGSGTIGGATTISGVLSPGNSIGTLTVANEVTWNGGENWVFELGAAGPSIGSPGTSDLLAITDSNFLKGTGSAFTFDFDGTATSDGWYKLVDWSGGTTTFDAVDFVGVNLGGVYTSEFAIQENALYVNVVPEPSTYALLAFAAAGIGAHVFRRRRCR